MKLSGLDTDTIANITNLSPDEIDKLQSKVSPRGFLEESDFVPLKDPRGF